MYFPEAASFLGSQVLHADPSLKIEGASIDSRTLKPGNLFVALPGTHTDGHQFLDTAFKRGASGALISENFAARNSPKTSWGNLIPVRDVAASFLKLAGAYRQGMPLKWAVGIAGSVGKTITKEFLAYLLKQKFSTLATQGNLNNHLGVPLTLFGLQPHHEICVCELGTNRRGDVHQLAEILKPDAGILTRIAPEHLEGFGSMEQVYQAEIELFECLKPGSPAILRDDDPKLFDLVRPLNLKIARVGFSKQADYPISGVFVENGFVHFRVQGREFAFPGFASFLAVNAALAIAMADCCGIKMEEIPPCWDMLKLPPGRFQEKESLPGIRVIFDGYNASPVSFEAALETFEEMACPGRKILVFSDMLEMGPAEKKWHEALGAKIAQSKLDEVWAYGPRSFWAVEAIHKKNPALNTHHFENARETARGLGGRLQKGDMLLLKASRGMKIEEVLENLPGH